MSCIKGSLLVGLLTLGCAECEKDFDCASSQICMEGACEALICQRDEDCAPGRRCAQNACQTVPAVAQPRPDATVTLNNTTSPD